MQIFLQNGPIRPFDTLKNALKVLQKSHYVQLKTCQLFSWLGLKESDPDPERPEK